MFSTIKSNKIARLAASSAALGTMAALLFLGAPADAAMAAVCGRGL